MTSQDYQANKPKLYVMQQDANAGTLNPGQLITGYIGLTPSAIVGTVHVNYPNDQPAKAQQLSVRFSGKVQVWWTETKHVHRNGKMERVNEHHKNTVRLVDETRLLWEEKEFPYKAIRREQHTFRIDLPNESSTMLATAVEIPHGEIRYKLEVLLKKKRKLFFGYTTKTIEVPVPVINLSPAVQPMHPSNNVQGSLVLPNHHLQLGMSWNCVVGPRLCVGPGDKLTLHLGIRGFPRGVSVKGIMFGIKRHAFIQDKWGTVRNMDKEYVVSVECTDPAQLTLRETDGSLGVSMYVIVPKREVTLVTVSAPQLTVKFKAKIKVLLKGAKDIEVEAPLVVSPLTAEQSAGMLNRANIA
ncbi:hypothetical protein GQ42DRAFT_159792 [Ramicandelaber brevisporus]|nr:hypothetical protein GQ42DRAFT_159792 [Ramicandelaber brevisporus]